MLDRLKDFFGSYTASGAVEYIVAGLGNPGRQYEETRHNAGFMAVDYISGRLGFKITRLRFKALCGDVILGGKRVLFIKPSNFMNNSGESVRDAMRFYKIPPERVIILFDEASLDTGAMRIRRKGSDGGHNGVKSILYLTGQDSFPRIKIGIGRKPRPDMDLADWVLSKFTKKDLADLKPVWDNVLNALELMVAGNIDAAMNRYN